MFLLTTKNRHEAENCNQIFFTVTDYNNPQSILLYALCCGCCSSVNKMSTICTVCRKLQNGNHHRDHVISVQLNCLPYQFLMINQVSEAPKDHFSQYVVIFPLKNPNFLLFWPHFQLLILVRPKKIFENYSSI